MQECGTELLFPFPSVGFDFTFEKVPNPQSSLRLPSLLPGTAPEPFQGQKGRSEVSQESGTQRKGRWESRQHLV